MRWRETAYCSVKSIKQDMSEGGSGVQFSSVQFSSNGVLRRPSLPDPSGASDREGTARRNWHGWKSGAGMVCLPQCRASSARGPPLTRLGDLAFLARQGPSRRQWRWRRGGKGGRGRYGVRATPCPRTISRTCARATQASATCHLAMGATAEVLAQDAEREQQREAGRRRRGRRQQ
jgi:hypothetical protein